VRAMLVIDMQVGMLENDPPPKDVDSVVQRINQLARVLHSAGRPGAHSG
jgi:nicotinamidase-related amidase